jgi:hypothetical protein
MDRIGVDDMEECSVHVSREMLEDPVDVEIDGEVLFAGAKERAVAVARARMRDPMLVAWYDRNAETYSPPVSCCGEDEPAWLIYARSRGANLTVSVNGESYVFLFADFDQEESEAGS